MSYTSDDFNFVPRMPNVQPPPQSVVGAPMTNPTQPGWFGIDGLGKNLGSMQLGLAGLQSIGSIWNAFQQQKLAGKQFKASKEFADTNLNNQIKSYNTALEDRSRGRAHQEGQAPSEAAAYVDRNKLSR